MTRILVVSVGAAVIALVACRAADEPNRQDSDDADLPGMIVAEQPPVTIQPPTPIHDTDDSDLPGTVIAEQPDTDQPRTPPARSADDLILTGTVEGEQRPPLAQPESALAGSAKEPDLPGAIIAEQLPPPSTPIPAAVERGPVALEEAPEIDQPGTVPAVAADEPALPGAVIAEQPAESAAAPMPLPGSVIAEQVPPPAPVPEEPGLHGLIVGEQPPGMGQQAITSGDEDSPPAKNGPDHPDCVSGWHGTPCQPAPAAAVVCPGDTSFKLEHCLVRFWHWLTFRPRHLCGPHCCKSPAPCCTPSLYTFFLCDECYLTKPPGCSGCGGKTH
jgi:hypothetical protein